MVKCPACAPECEACTALLCTRCKSNYFNNNGICTLCPLTTYFSRFGDICEPCPVHCLTCDMDNCFSC
jgi:hypothetical protein